MNRSTISSSAYQTWKVDKRFLGPRTPHPASHVVGHSDCGKEKPCGSCKPTRTSRALVITVGAGPCPSFHSSPSSRRCILMGSCAIKWRSCQLSRAWRLARFLAGGTTTQSNPIRHLFLIPFAFQKTSNSWKFLGCGFHYNTVPCVLVPPSPLVIRSSPGFSGQWHGMARKLPFGGNLCDQWPEFSACLPRSSIGALILICSYLWQSCCDVRPISYQAHKCVGFHQVCRSVVAKVLWTGLFSDPECR
ncbi:hypothetical protein BKA64DRAFT_147006 [Cadophora sp. MPI-SDFR-AT-0126]|nr:hypothetical protein BKA64DRAFT_147006 [Leotiomycetes sp. MPI-SDFR-AT-0126]